MDVCGKVQIAPSIPTLLHSPSAPSKWLLFPGVRLSDEWEKRVRGGRARYCSGFYAQIFFFRRDAIPRFRSVDLEKNRRASAGGGLAQPKLPCCVCSAERPAGCASSQTKRLQRDALLARSRDSRLESTIPKGVPFDRSSGAGRLWMRSVSTYTARAQPVRVVVARPVCKAQRIFNI